MWSTTLHSDHYYDCKSCQIGQDLKERKSQCLTLTLLSYGFFFIIVTFEFLVIVLDCEFWVTSPRLQFYSGHLWVLLALCLTALITFCVSHNECVLLPSCLGAFSHSVNPGKLILFLFGLLLYTFLNLVYFGVLNQPQQMLGSFWTFCLHCPVFGFSFA